MKNLLLLCCFLALASCRLDQPKPAPPDSPVPTAAPVEQADTIFSVKTTLASTAPMNRPEMEVFCQKILQRLWSASDLRLGRKMPALLVDLRKKDGASYGDNTIIVEQAAFRVCQSLGPEWFEGALAFIIAHELAHFFQREQSGASYSGYRSSFLGFDKIAHSQTGREEKADLSGAFNLYLANFSLDTATMSTLIDCLYREYHLPDNLPDYPSKAERKKTAHRTLQQMADLALLYQQAAFFSAFGDWDAAIAAYEAILPHYQGHELYANLGAADARKALFVLDKKADAFGCRKYLFPLETDWDTPLRQETSPIKFYASNDPAYLLKSALEHTNKALAMEPHYKPALLNRFIILVLSEKKGSLGSIKDALDGSMPLLGTDSPERSAALLTYGIACACFGQNDTVRMRADSIFEAVARCPDASLSAMARHNLAARQGKVPKSAPAPAWPPEWTQPTADLPDLCTRSVPLQSLSVCPSVRLGFQALNGSTLMVWEQGRTRTAVQRIPLTGSAAVLPSGGEARALRLAGGGGIQVSAAQQAGLRWERGRVKERFRYCQKKQ